MSNRTLIAALLRHMPSCWRTGHLIRDVEIAHKFGWLGSGFGKTEAARIALWANLEAVR